MGGGINEGGGVPSFNSNMFSKSAFIVGLCVFFVAMENLSWYKPVIYRGKGFYGIYHTERHFA